MNRTRVIAVVMGMLAVSVFAGKSSGMTKTYTFDPSQSTVIERFLTSHTYNLAGSFQLTINANVALFESVDAILSEKPHSFPQELGELFYMGELVGDVVNGTTIEFGLPPGHPLRQSYDLRITLTYQNEHMRLAGLRFPLMIGEPGFTLEAVAGTCPAKIIYVDDDAAGANNGSSWSDAYDYLQDALMFAAAGDEIRVAQGIYRPDDFVLSDRPNLGREETFQLVSGVTLKGGYAGLGEPEPNARNITQYPTILSGDLLANDFEVTDPCNLPDEPTRAENSNHIVTAGGTDRTAILDGFTVTGGYANRNMGGGMYNNAGSPSLYNCTFAGNFAEYGGGMYNSDGASPLLTDCIFNGNAAFDEEGTGGGGMCNDESNPTLINCTFTDNWASVGIPDHGGGDGGAMANYGSSPILTGCTFNYNTALCDGGGMFNDYCNPTVANCTFTANTGRYGGAIHNLQAEPVFTNCIFGGNTARNSGGAVYNVYLSDVILTNCTFAGNRAPAGSAIACYAHHPEHSSSIHVTNCIIWDAENSIWNGGDSIITVTYSDIRYAWPGEGNMDIDPLFADADNGDYHLKSQAGRWDANEGHPTGPLRGWTTDEVTSPCIDAGDPMSPIGLEPFPNGGIINMGAYGGTAEASKSYFGTPPCETIVAGDINGDCIVDFKDFAIIALHWLEGHD